jgi:aspartate racemase
MKTIGILGGLGPQATIDFEHRLHRAAQRLISQHGNTGYPPLVSWFFRETPVLLSGDSPRTTTRPPLNPRLLEAAQALGGHADFLVIPANGVHLWQAEIEQAAGKPIVSLVDAVIDDVRRRGWRHVGLADFRPSGWGVYGPRIAQLGATWVELPDTMQERLSGVVRAVGEGRSGAAEAALLGEAIEFLRAHGADGIILACTEFPLALTGALAPDIINPAELLAEASIHAALA